MPAVNVDRHTALLPVSRDFLEVLVRPGETQQAFPFTGLRCRSEIVGVALQHSGKTGAEIAFMCDQRDSGIDL